MINFDRLIKLLSYDPSTGQFVRVKTQGHQVAGVKAGSLRSDGYYSMVIDGHRYLMHRLAWLYMTGSWPKFDIDHIDGNPSNNSFSNLRDVETSVNLQNQKKATKKNKTTGLLGSFFNSQYGKYQAQIRVFNRIKYIGRYDTAEEAHAAYISKKRKLHLGCTI